jgi:hypothetical protein
MAPDSASHSAESTRRSYRDPSPTIEHEGNVSEKRKSNTKFWACDRMLGGAIMSSRMFGSKLNGKPPSFISSIN